MKEIDTNKNTAYPNGIDSAEELRPEYMKMAAGQVLCKYGFELFHSQLEQIQRLRSSVYRLTWITFLEGLALLLHVILEKFM